MKSAGNDIVALNAIDIQRTISPAFYSKFVTAPELQVYNQPQIAEIPFQNFIWLLWSVKESAYKFLKRRQPHFVFSPSKIIVQDIIHEDYYSGTALTDGYQLFFRSKIAGEFIASVVHDNALFENVYWDVNLIADTSNENQSKQVREFALNRLSAITGLDNLRIEKDVADCPIVMQGESKLNIPVSLAHHANFVAYSFYAPQ